MEEVFSGVRIIELAQFVFAPAAGALLVDAGFSTGNPRLMQRAVIG